jgi:FMN phosphatase YigB (HAD superfamily)
LAAANATRYLRSSSETPLTLTLLLDLDDTLLQNNIEDFLPAYFRLLSDHLTPLVDPARLIECLIHATRRMIANQRPDLSLEAVFEADFYPGLGVDRTRFKAFEEQFYEQVYPRLRSKTRPRPAAQRLVAQAAGLEASLAVATNPLFPRSAIAQRLDWAELGRPPDSFGVISSMETFHFAKPAPAFWAEVLAQLGWPQGPVVAVGDDYRNDIAAAGGLGLPAYWVSSDSSPGQTTSSGPPQGAGRLDGLLAWVEEQGVEALRPRFDTPESALAILASTVAALQQMADLTPEPCWSVQPAPGEWSLTEILCHLLDVEREVNLPRLELVLRVDDPFIAAQDTHAWAEDREYRLQDGGRALSEFIAARLETLRILRSLSPDDWGRRARHSIFGPTDLLEIALIIASHDRQHLRQIHRLPR